MIYNDTRSGQEIGLFQIFSQIRKQRISSNIQLPPPETTCLRKRLTIDVQKDVERCMQRSVTFHERNTTGVCTLGQEKKSQVKVLVSQAREKWPVLAVLETLRQCWKGSGMGERGGKESIRTLERGRLSTNEKGKVPI